LATDYQKYEQSIFGGTDTGQGQAKFLLSMTKELKGNSTYSKGIPYFSFPFNMGGNTRKYIEENREFTLCLLFRKEASSRARRAVLASLWLLGHVGGLGSRSRRGFGTVALVDWKTDNFWPELELLAPVQDQPSVQNWKDSFQTNIKVLKEWFPSPPVSGHLTLGDKTVFHLVTNNERGFPSWDAALSHAAEIMRLFRNRTNPDYTNVKAYISGNGATPLAQAPERSAFGLPLTFRYNSLNGARTIFQGSIKNETRSGSRIFIRVVQIGAKFYPLFCRLNGNLLSPGNTITDRYNKKKKGYALPLDEDKLLDKFMKNLPHGENIQW